MLRFTEVARPWKVTLYDGYYPAAVAGTYRVRVEQHVYNADGTEHTPALEGVTRAFDVRSIQVDIPEGTVHSRVPADGSTGFFDLVLPHISLNRTSLPWERELSRTETPSKRKRDTQRVPWVALLVFAEKELPGDPGARGLTEQRTAAAFVNPAATDVHWPKFTIDVPGATVCRTIDVPAALFRDVVPRFDELRHLAHCRKVDARKTRNLYYIDGEDLEVGQFAVVTANRLPVRNARYVVHLVSLEGCEDYVRHPDQLTKPVRLLSLHSWSFENYNGTGLEFEPTVTGLAVPGLTDPSALLLRLPSTGITALPGTDEAARAHVSSRLEAGYVPLTYQVPTGERIPGWYRGPLTPVVPTAPERDAKGFLSAEECLVYLESEGVFDISYAAAWTIGKALVLANADLSKPLLEARTRGWETVRLAGAYLRSNPEADLAELRAHLDHPGGLARFARMLERGLGDRLGEAMAAPPLRRPAAGPDSRDSTPVRPAEAMRDPSPDVLALAGEQMVRHLATGNPGIAARDHALLHPAPLPDADPVVPPGATGLDALTLLCAVPFHYLVPDWRMLLPANGSTPAGTPAGVTAKGLAYEGMRLFHLDPAWLNALVDGALSVGVSTTLDAKLAAKQREDLTAPGVTVTGLLMRSRLPTAYPGLVIEAHAGPDKEQLTVLRRDLTNDVLMLLFAGIPDTIVIREPGHGIHMGIDADGQTGRKIPLRALTGDIGEELGTEFDFTGVLECLRPRPAGVQPDVLDLKGTATSLLGRLSDALRAAKQSVQGDLAPSQFALQLTRAPQQLTLRRTEGHHQ
ncbi:hypothetical protein ACFXGA_09685 [Actinosynnema sp. NPDC059335]|uniref:hypothetical protein n=1 Tax=Actinosynnema sp. NPDC059335 TaxID=3346804 RepID=UPI00366E4CA4